MKKITEVKTIQVHLQDATRVMERAVKQALDLAYNLWGIDECGHSDRVEEWARSDSNIRIEFKSLGAFGGGSVYVEFETWCEKNDEE